MNERGPKVPLTWIYDKLNIQTKFQKGEISEKEAEQRMKELAAQTRKWADKQPKDKDGGTV